LAFNAVPSPRGPEWTGEVTGKAEPGAGTVEAWTVAGWDRTQSLEAVREAREEAQAVIVMIHWGYEYDLRTDPAQRQIARELVEAGATLVAGHHPHVVQDLEVMPATDGSGDALVAYSLGNFVFDQGFEHTGQGLALRAFFDEQGLRAVQVLPVSASLRPAWQSPEQAGELLERILPDSPPGDRSRGEPTAWRCERRSCSTIPLPDTIQVEQPGQAANIDLDGDGLDEKVSQENGRVKITATSSPDWQSPEEWRVVDLAAGDPNGDGRGELLLALQKPERSGVLLSHPFVFGYRQGSWRILWGGSGVSDPILETALGDLDGDGGQELVVLEALHAGPERSVSVWRWNGWGFSRVWRSEPGWYTNLRLVPVETGEIVVVDRMKEPTPAPP
jgi:poly-gamma-glutamate synthesis protein (capsule biosynthesis protein)